MPNEHKRILASRRACSCMWQVRDCRVSKPDASLPSSRALPGPGSAGCAGSAGSAPGAPSTLRGAVPGRREQGSTGKAWAEEVLRRHQQRLQQREEMRRCKASVVLTLTCLKTCFVETLNQAEQRAEEDLKECSFAPKLVSQSHVQLQIRKGRRQLEHLAEQQQAILFRLDRLRDEEVRAATAKRSVGKEETRSLLLGELAQVDDDAHDVIRSLVKLGIPSVLEEPDPATLCPQYDSGLLRRLRMEDAWGFKELAPIRTAGADEGDAAMRRLSDRRRAEVMESNTLPQMQAVMNRV
eukprot:s1811_g17.t2